jgi:hypothetical protein
MVEMYTMQRFLDPHGLQSRGIEHFDAWAATFGEVVDTMEISPDGAGLRPRSRFARFTNLPELQQMFRAFSDVQTAGMLNLPCPRLQGGKPIVVACRVYRSEREGLQRVPPIDAITSALRIGARNNSNRGLRSWLAILPAIGVAMLPKLACPACWPAYAGLLSSIGLGFLTQTAYLLPLTVAFLVLAVGALGISARNRHEFGPFVTGLVAALIVIVGKFQFESDPAMYGGIALLIGASVWNTWPKQNKTPSCPACCRAGDR